MASLTPPHDWVKCLLSVLPTHALCISEGIRLFTLGLYVDFSVQLDCEPLEYVNHFVPLAFVLEYLNVG